jgi:redox-sensitive bicupin YhaK (pirin superfamily)
MDMTSQDSKQVTSVRPAKRGHWVGDGFPVRSFFDYGPGVEEVSPFLILDYAAPAEFPPAVRPRGVGEHPHRGFETVTIVYQGSLEHRDSTGAGGSIGPGDVQWMTAASGILHEEFHSREFTRAGGMLEMAQLWVNLPARDKAAAPGYQTILDGDIPAVTLPGGAGRLRVIAGEHGGMRGPARTFTPLDVWDVRLERNGRAELDVPAGRTLAIAVLRGTVEVNGEHVARDGETVILSREGSRFTIEANGEASLLVLSGDPIEEPVVGYGPFVMNSPAEIQQAIADFNAGRFGRMEPQPQPG